MDKSDLSRFTNMSVRSAVFKNAIPSIVAMLMVLIYNLADTFFIGQTRNDFQVAAVSLATPVFLFFTAFGNVFGIGGSSVISRSLGEGKYDYVKKVSSFCMWSCVIVGIAFMAFLLIFMDDILVLIGASAETYEYTKTYLTIVSFCGPFVLVGTCFSNVIRGEGKPGVAMTGMFIGNLTNIILDPIMILTMGLEIKGAAIATVIGNIFGAAYYIIYFLRKKSILSINIKDFTLKEKVFSKTISIGIPSSLGSILMSVAQITANSVISKYGDMAVAAMGVTFKVMIIITLAAIGLGQGVQPLLGFCYGSRNKKRFKEILRFSLLFSFIMCACLTILCFVFINNIVGVFLTETTSIGYAVSFSRKMLTTTTLFGLFFVFMNSLQAMGAALPSLITSICRQGLIYIPSLFVLDKIFRLEGIIWSQPLSDLCSLIIVIIFYKITMKKNQKIFDEGNIPA